MNITRSIYETTFIVSASLEDSQIEAAINRTQEFITRNGGEISAVNRWGRRRLAYPIQKKNNGFYINLEYTADGSLIAQLERTFLLDENILRFLSIKLNKKALQARRQPPPSPPAEEMNTIVPLPPEIIKEPLFEDDIEVPIV